MVRGKKARARLWLEEANGELRALLKVGDYKTHQGHRRRLPYDAMAEAIARVSPWVGLSSVKRGGSAVKIPIALSGRRSERLGTRFLVEGAMSRANTGVPMARARVLEVMAVLKNADCPSLTRYRRLQKEAKANRMYVR